MSASASTSASAAAANLSSLFLKKTERYSKTELKLLQELFEVADKDKDGKLDAGELATLLERKPPTPHVSKSPAESAAGPWSQSDPLSTELVVLGLFAFMS